MIIINIGKGYDNIIFGMSMGTIKNLIGEPDKVSNCEIEYGIIKYFFNDLLLILNFDINKNNKLYLIEIYNPEAVLFDRKILGMSKNEVINLLILNGYTETEYEFYTHFESLSCDKIGGEFIFMFDRLKSIEITHLFSNDDEIIWPSIN